MPVHQSLLSSLSPSGEPLLTPPPESPVPPPVDVDAPPAAAAAVAAAAAAASGPAGLLPAQRRLLINKCHTAVTLQERRPSSAAGRLLRSLTPSRASLAPSVAPLVCPPSIRHAATLSSLEQARAGSATCSRCGTAHVLKLPADRRATCRVCLEEVPMEDLHRLAACGCRFCKECMSAYVAVCVNNGESEVRCPEPLCPSDGRLTASEVRRLTDAATYSKYTRLCYMHEVERDPHRTWCPRPGCDTACSLPAGAATFTCGRCSGTFCSVCRRPREGAAPHECRPERWLLGGSQQLGSTVKQCPRCSVPIERDDGCAQMMCRRCRHVFCWYCLASLDGDLFLRHYDRGPCRHLLGHTRGSLVWHRVQLVGALVGVGLVFVVAAPVLILFAPFFMCTTCQCDPGGAGAAGGAATPDQAEAGASSSSAAARHSPTLPD